MKNAGKCPKCAAENILRIPGASGAYGSGNNIPVGFTIFSAVTVSRYVCPSCGFSEEWIDDPTDLDQLVEKFGGK